MSTSAMGEWCTWVDSIFQGLSGDVFEFSRRLVVGELGGCFHCGWDGLVVHSGPCMAYWGITWATHVQIGWLKVPWAALGILYIMDGVWWGMGVGHVHGVVHVGVGVAPQLHAHGCLHGWLPPPPPPCGWLDNGVVCGGGHVCMLNTHQPIYLGKQGTNTLTKPFNLERVGQASTNPSTLAKNLANIYQPTYIGQKLANIHQPIHFRESLASIHQPIYLCKKLGKHLSTYLTSTNPKSLTLNPKPSTLNPKCHSQLCFGVIEDVKIRM